MNPSNSVPTSAADSHVPQKDIGAASGPAAMPQYQGDAVMPLPPSIPPVPIAPPQITAAAPQAPWLEPPVPVQPTSPPKDAAVSDPQVSSVGAPAVADDGDLIEKEWVQGAKQIVERTRQDPHQQVKAMHAFKAEYMKKRYNKVIEPVEE